MSVHELLQRATGLDLAPASVERAIRQRMKRRAVADIDNYLEAVTPDELDALIELVVVPESWMFRDPEAFTAATRFVKQRVGTLKRQVRILSIPCAGGEEPYSMAMALQDAGVPPSAYLIDAIDLSRVAIERAQRGVYTRNAFRSRHLDYRERYFTASDGDYQLIDAVRKQVRFAQGNLLAFDVGARAGWYDVIFCRNLLIYFDVPTTAAAIAKLRMLLADDGILFSGHAEVPSFCQNGFAAIRQPQAFALQKTGAVAPAGATGSASQQRPAQGRPAAPPLAVPATSPRERARSGPDAGAAAGQPAVWPAAATTSSSAAQRSARDADADAQASALASATVAGTPASRPGSRTGQQAKTAAPASAPPSPAQLLEQARRLADQGELQAAQARCETLLAQQPDNAEAYFILGMVSECARQSAAAEQHWRRCIYLQPDHYEALCHLALLSEQAGNRSGAAGFKARAARVFERRAGAAKGSP